MKKSVYTALNNTYGTNERRSMEPVAFDCVPEKRHNSHSGLLIKYFDIGANDESFRWKFESRPY